MTLPQGADHCPPDQMSGLIATIQTNETRGLQQVSTLIERYPTDGRLHFLRGSMLATAGRYDEARASMATATVVAPYFWVARFQLGLLELTSGLAAESAATLAPLADLGPTNPLQSFAAGLQALMVDDFTRAVSDLRRGISLNTDLPPLNRDMQMLIDRIETGDWKSLGEEPVSATQLLLQTLGRAGPSRN